MHIRKSTHMPRYIVVFLVSITACYNTPDTPEDSVDAGPTFEECNMASGNLPFSRNTNYAAGSQVQSVDLNEMQDVDIANIGDLILGLGGTTANNLAELITQGTFTPVFVDTFASGPTYAEQYGRYSRLGPYVEVDIDLGWTNTDAAFDASNMRILLPWAAAAESVGVSAGVLHPQSDMGTEAAGKIIAAPTVGTLGHLFVFHRTTDWDGVVGTLDYGSDARRVRFHISYCTDGTYNY
jgi:hypothetical protein